MDKPIFKSTGWCKLKKPSFIKYEKALNHHLIQLGGSLEQQRMKTIAPINLAYIYSLKKRTQY